MAEVILNWDLESIKTSKKRYTELYEKRGKKRRVDCIEVKYLDHGTYCSSCGSTKAMYSRNAQERSADEGTTLYMFCENGHKLRM